MTESLYEPLFLAVYCQPKNFTSEGNPIHKPTGNAVFYIMLPLFVLAHFSHHLVSALLTPLLPFIRDTISFDYTRAGFLVFAYNIAYGGSQLPGGWLGDRLGFRTLITIGISGVALAGFLFGFSSGFSMMVIILLFMGIMGGGYHPSASPLISSIVEKKYRGRALGIHQVGGTASFFLAPLIAVGIARVLGWRGCFFSLSTDRPELPPSDIRLLFDLLHTLLRGGSPRREQGSCRSFALFIPLGRALGWSTRRIPLGSVREDSDPALYGTYRWPPHHSPWTCIPWLEYFNSTPPDWHDHVYEYAGNRGICHQSCSG